MDEGVSLRDYQIADLAYYMHAKKCLNLSDPGTGKTPSVVVMQWWMWDTLGIGTAWAMPKSLLKKNRDEILRFTHFKPEDVVIVDNVQPLSKAQNRLNTDDLRLHPAEARRLPLVVEQLRHRRRGVPRVGEEGPPPPPRPEL